MLNPLEMVLLNVVFIILGTVYVGFNQPAPTYSHEEEQEYANYLSQIDACKKNMSTLNMDLSHVRSEGEATRKSYDIVVDAFFGSRAVSGRL